MRGFTCSRIALRIAAAAFILACVAAPAKAQFWNKKNYTKWSTSECRKILSDSPWAQTYSAVAIKYTAEFFSALPVREAQVRLAQIEAHYTRMSSAQRKAFDESAANYLSVRYPKYTVIRVSYSPNVDSYDQATLAILQRNLQVYWQSLDAPEFRNTVFASVDGKTVRLAEYKFAPPREQAFFLFFPRDLGGKPLLGPRQKSLTLQLTDPSIHFSNGFAPNGSVTSGPAPAGDIQMEFSVRKMVFHGKLAY